MQIMEINQVELYSLIAMCTWLDSILATYTITYARILLTMITDLFQIMMNMVILGIFQEAPTTHPHRHLHMLIASIADL